MIRPRRSWRATTAPRWRTCFWMSPAAATGRPHNEQPDVPDCAAPDRGDDPALLVHPAIVLAAHAGAGLLADAADHHLGLPAELYQRQCRLLRPRRRHADRRRDPVGHPVPRPARLLHLLPG